MLKFLDLTGFLWWYFAEDQRSGLADRWKKKDFHNWSADNCLWIIIHNLEYDLTQYGLTQAALKSFNFFFFIEIQYALQDGTVSAISIIAGWALWGFKKLVTPWIYINDDEIELKRIIVRYGNLKKYRKFTVSEAEKRGLVKVEHGPKKFRDDKFSKAIAILNDKVSLCLSTKGLNG